MKSDKLKIFIAEGEGLTVEFKEKYTPKIDRDIVALANAKGGFIVLGVNDEGKIVGEKLTNTMKAEILSLARNCDPHITISKVSPVDSVVVIEVAEGDEKPYSCSSGYFRRLDAVTQKMVQKEVRTLFRDSSAASFEGLPHNGFGLKDISLGKINAFLVESKTSVKAALNNVESMLASLEILEKEKINNAGVLMFARNVGRFIPHAEIICGAFKGTNKTYIYDRKDVRDDLLTQLNEAMAFIRKHINVRSEIREINRYDIYEIPIDALREAVVNAIIHRDYSMTGTSIYVSVYDDRVEIENPGGLPAGLSLQDFGKTSVRRNLIIADLFHRMSKVERIGSGIKRMRDLMKDAGLKEPHFEMTAFFRASFYRDPRYSLKKLEVRSGSKKDLGESAEKVRRKYGENAEKVFVSVKDDLFIKTHEIADRTQLSQRTVENAIAKLKKAGLLKRIGPDKGGHWEVVK